MNSVSCASLAMPLQYFQPSATAKFIKPNSQRNRTEHLVGIFFISCTRKSYGLCPWQPTVSKSVTNPSISRYEGKRALTHIKVYALKNPKGFGPVPKKKMKKKTKEIEYESEEDDEGGESSDVIPEVVTNRMMKRIGIFVGAPLAIGICFFPLFYYMKVVLKWNVPDWLPFITSFFTFGSAALGISYGIVSSSWDPLREGSLLGWTETQKNWPVFWQSVWQKPGKRKEVIESKESEMSKKGKEMSRASYIEDTEIPSLFSDTVCHKDYGITSWEAMCKLFEDQGSKVITKIIATGIDSTSDATLFDVACSFIHKIAARPKLMPYTDMIKWAIKNFNIKNRVLKNSRGEFMGSFKAKYLATMYYLPSP